MSIDEQSEASPVLAETVDGFEVSDPGLKPTPEPEVAPEIPVKVKAKPVEAAERVASVDVIRGFALLGILAMNIVDFGWPEPVYSTPIRDPEAGPLDIALWAFNHVIFDTKMMTLFSMLFGAGLVLMSERAVGRGAKPGWVFYRRTFWLLVIGLVHAYLVWSGDILVMYASCGFFLYLFRKLRPRTLLITGTCFVLMFIPLLIGFRLVVVPYMKRTYERVEAQQKADQKPDWWDKKVHGGYRDMTKQEMPKHDDFMKSIMLHRGPYNRMVKERAKQLIWVQTLGFVFGAWWFAGGRMLIGMGLMKLGVFAAELSKRAYLWMMIVGYGIGVPVMLFDCYHQISNGFFLGRGFEYLMQGWILLVLVGSLPVVFGHIGLVMLICKTGALPWLTRRLAAVGRMALSSYLFDSLLCTTLFYGYGFDLFATLHRPMLYVLVVVIWTFHLLICPLWLEVFRYGPAEWVWRSLTYWKPQKMLQTAV
jgi:uncharacterized protein